MNKTTKIVVVTLIATIILGSALYPTISRYFKEKEVTEVSNVSAPPAAGRGGPLNINVKIIEPENLVDIVRATGNLIPDEEVDLTFETSGKITNINFQEGTSVKKGQLLAKVNDGPLQAELQKLQAQIPLAEGRVFRQKSLLEKDAVSQEAYEQVTTELDKLLADIELVQARILQTELRAPFDGVVGLRQVSEGAFVSPTTIIASLTKIIPLKVEFSVPENHFNVIRPGTQIYFRTRNDINVYNAKVYAVESSLRLTTRTLLARAIFPNSDGRLIPGGMADIEIKSNEIVDALTIPSEAIIAEMGRSIAYLYSDGKAKQVEVIRGLRTESNVQAIEGLRAGDTLIVTGVMQLRDGFPVKIDRIIQ
jgi:membrane fusion protein (multidrug efflux system)